MERAERSAAPQWLGQMKANSDPKEQSHNICSREKVPRKVRVNRFLDVEEPD